jgi:hypothetical protein
VIRFVTKITGKVNPIPELIMAENLINIKNPALLVQNRVFVL